MGAYHEKLPDSLMQKLNCQQVHFRGQINPPNEEFLSSHCLLVATPIELGIRVRIITAFSFGCCIVAHKANAKGIPELVHGYNSLLGETGQELARHCITIFEDPVLRRKLERNSRKTYERWFQPRVVGEELLGMIKNKT